VNSWWSLGRLRGVLIRMHWSAIFGAIFFSGMRFAPGAWLGFIVVILAHELGHAFIVRRTGQHVHGVDIHGLGGECRWSGHATPLERALIAWGGVWAQLALFAIALPLGWLLGSALGTFGLDFFHALTWSSLWLAALNLIPFPPLDGAEAWKLPRHLNVWWKNRQARKQFARPPVRQVLRESIRDEGLHDGRKPIQEPGVRVVSQSNDLEEFFRKVARDAREARRSSSGARATRFAKRSRTSARMARRPMIG
jgi:stage IV sporulation protein FB